MNSLGLAVIIHNEKALIDKFIQLNHIFDLFSEIRFADDYSTDGTYELLQEYEKVGLCNVYRRKLDFNFAEQRNYLGRLMLSDYILRLDVDEIMNEKLIKQIRDLNLDRDFYKIQRTEVVDGKFLCFTETPFIYRNCDSIKWNRRLHEFIIGAQTTQVLDSSYTIIHDKTKDRCERQNVWYFNNFDEQKAIVNVRRRKKK